MTQLSSSLVWHLILKMAHVKIGASATQQKGQTFIHTRDQQYRQHEEKHTT